MYNPQLERTIYGGLTLAEYIQAYGPKDAVDVIAWRLNCETFVCRYCGYPDCQRHLIGVESTSAGWAWAGGSCSYAWPRKPQARKSWAHRPWTEGPWLRMSLTCPDAVIFGAC